MKLHQRFDSREEYIAFFNDLMDWKFDINRSLWNPEDYDIIKPYFQYSQCRQRDGITRNMNNAEKKAFKHYAKCYDSYASERAELRDSIKFIPEEYLINNFWIIDLNKDDEDGGEYVFALDPEFPHSFPLVLTGHLMSDYDRMGEMASLSIDFVELKDFVKA